MSYGVLYPLCRAGEVAALSVVTGDAPFALCVPRRHRNPRSAFRVGQPASGRPARQQWVFDLGFASGPAPVDGSRWASGLAAKLADLAGRGRHVVTITPWEAPERWSIDVGADRVLAVSSAGRAIGPVPLPAVEELARSVQQALRAGACHPREPLAVEVVPTPQRSAL